MQWFPLKLTECEDTQPFSGPCSPEEARQFCLLFPWCEEAEVLETFGDCCALGHFLVSIKSPPGLPDRLSVFVGDVPPFFLDARIFTAERAKHKYLDLCSAWLAAFEGQGTWPDLPPLCCRYSLTDADHSRENKENLERRVAILNSQEWDGRLDPVWKQSLEAYWPAEPPTDHILMPSSRFSELGAEGSRIAEGHLSLAQSYLLRHAHINGGVSFDLYRGWEKFSVFLASYNDEKNMDKRSWIVVGDGPPFMVSSKGCPSGAGALKAYADYLSRWSDPGAAGGPDLQPLLSAEGTREINADSGLTAALGKRARLILEDFLPAWREDDILGRDASESDPGYK